MYRWLPIIVFLAACSAQVDQAKGLEDGKHIYERACARCHDTGLDGAQLIGDRDGWRSRLSQGMEILTRHSIEGFEGAVGHMPARGDDPTLSDDEVAAAARYLVEQSR